MAHTNDMYMSSSRKRHVQSLEDTHSLRSLDYHFDNCEVCFRVVLNLSNSLLNPFLTLLGDRSHDVNSLLEPFQALSIDDEGRRSHLVDSLGQSLGQEPAKCGLLCFKPTVGEWDEIVWC